MEHGNRKPVSRYPRLKTDKESIRISGTTVIRKRAPTNVQAVSKHPNMVWDYSRQQAVWPDSKPKSLLEATQTTSNTAYRTMNRSGQPFALDCNVGGSPDDRGMMYEKAKKTRIIK